MTAIVGTSLATALRLIVLHYPDGQPVEINPAQVTSTRGPVASGQQTHFSTKVKCMVNLTDGKFVAVVETCAEVRALLEKD